MPAESWRRFSSSCAARGTLYTSWVLLKVSSLSGEGSYEAIALKTLGVAGSVSVQLLIVLNAFLICVSVQGLFVDLIGSAIMPRPAMVLISGAVAWPVTALIRRVDRLAPLSIITALTAVIMLGFVLARAAIGPLPAPNLSPGPTGSIANRVWLDAFSTIVIGFVVQFNVLPVYQSLPGGDGSDPAATATAHHSMMLSLTLGMALTLFLYVATEILAYLTFGSSSYTSLLTAYTEMPGGGFATGQLGIGQLLSYPIMAHAAVTEVSKWLTPLFDRASSLLPVASAAASGKPTETTPLSGGGTLKQQQQDQQVSEGGGGMARLSEPISGTLWVLLTTGMSLIVADVSSLLAVVGAACATPLMTIFPPLMLLKQQQQQQQR